MSGRVAVLGEASRVEPWVLAGALVRTADGPDDVLQAWAELPEDVEVVVLTPSAHRHLAGLDDGRLVVELP